MLDEMAREALARRVEDEFPVGTLAVLPVIEPETGVMRVSEFSAIPGCVRLVPVEPARAVQSVTSHIDKLVKVPAAGPGKGGSGVGPQ